MRYGLICRVVLYSTPPYMQGRLIFDAALYAESPYIRRRFICRVALYSTPPYIQGHFIFHAALYSGLRHNFPKNILTVWHVGVKKTAHVAISNITHSNYYINTDIDTCQHANMPTCQVCVCVCVWLVKKYYTGAKIMRLAVERTILPSVICHKY